MFSQFITPAAIVATLAFSTVAQAEKVNLDLKLQKDQVLKYRIQTNGTNTTSSSKTPQQQTFNQDITFSLKVDEVSDAGAMATLTYDAISIALVSAKGTSSFNSADSAETDTANQLAPVLRPVVGAPLKVSIDKAGKVTKVEGGESLIRPGPQGPMAAQFVNLQGVQQLVGGVLSTFAPPGGVDVGGTWTGEDLSDMAQLGKYTRSSLFTLKAASEADATVEFNGTLERDVSGQQSPFNLTESTYTGGFVWDRKTGTMTKLTRDLEVTLGSELNGIKAELKRIVHLTVERVEGEAKAPAAEQAGAATKAGE